MKYIKEYKSEDKLDELEDYLQEFFDNNNIKQIGVTTALQPNLPCWTRMSSIYIFFDRKDQSKIQYQLKKIHPLLEKRLGQVIEIDRPRDMRSYLYIKISI